MSSLDSAGGEIITQKSTINFKGGTFTGIIFLIIEG